MKKRRWTALVLSLLLVFQLAASPRAEAANYVYFVAAGENVLPLTDPVPLRAPARSNRYFFRSSSGIKSKVISFKFVRSWVYFTPAESIIFFEARVDMESAYLSDR